MSIVSTIILGLLELTILLLLLLLNARQNGLDTSWTSAILSRSESCQLWSVNLKYIHQELLKFTLVDILEILLVRQK